MAAEDLDRLAWSLALLGRNDLLFATLERLYNLQLHAGDLRGAARAAFWLGFRLLFLGEMGRATGWIATSQRVLERLGEDCPKRGYHFLPQGLGRLSQKDAAGACEAARQGAEIGERFGDANLTSLSRAIEGQARIALGERETGLDPAITQLHSADYRRPAQLPPGDILLVGAGNSGAEIAIDLIRAGRRVWISGRDVGQVPFSVRNPMVRRLVLPILFRIVFHRILTLGTPIGRKVRPKMVTGGLPLIRTRSGDLAAAGVTRVPRMEGVRDGYPLLADGTVRRVSGVVWCTGFDMGQSWIDLPVFAPHGEPIQERGVVPDQPGLYFVGPHFLYSASSTMIHGIGRDARYVARRIAALRRAAADTQSTAS